VVNTTSSNRHLRLLFPVPPTCYKTHPTRWHHDQISTRPAACQLISPARLGCMLASGQRDMDGVVSRPAAGGTAVKHRVVTQGSNHHLRFCNKASRGAAANENTQRTLSQHLVEMYVRALQCVVQHPQKHDTLSYNKCEVTCSRHRLSVYLCSTPNDKASCVRASRQPQMRQSPTIHQHTHFSCRKDDEYI
jgi:hypothetical protein